MISTSVCLILLINHVFATELAVVGPLSVPPISSSLLWVFCNIWQNVLLLLHLDVLPLILPLKLLSREFLLDPLMCIELPAVC